MGRTFPQWQGFTVAPQGHLLEQLVDLRGEMGIAYERMVDFHKDFHAHDRLSFVCPRGACVMEIKTRSPAGGYRLGSGDLLVLPRSHAHSIRAYSSVFDAVALYPTAAQLERVARDTLTSPRVLERFTSSASKLRRSPWLDQLLVQYFSRRVLTSSGNSRHPAPDLKFFEAELTREVFRIAGLWLPERRKSQKSHPAEKIADRALQFIEANLFGPLTLDGIAKHSHASLSTLLRRFAQRTGISPLKYARARRLDEGRALLKKGAHNVTEVAMLIGYNSPGAFCEAFRRQFGEPPSSARHSLQLSSVLRVKARL